MTSANLLIGAAIVGTMALIGAMTALAVVRRSWRFVVAAGALGVGLAAATLPLPWDPQGGVLQPLSIALVVVALAVVYVALEEPAWLVGRLWVKDADARQREFDWRLTRLVDEFNEVLRIAKEAPTDAEAHEALRADAKRVFGKVLELRAPSDSWAELVSMYVTLLRIHLDEFGSPLPEDVERYFRELNGRATVKRELLRAQYARPGPSKRRPT